MMIRRHVRVDDEPIVREVVRRGGISRSLRQAGFDPEVGEGRNLRRTYQRSVRVGSFTERMADYFVVKVLGGHMVDLYGFNYETFKLSPRRDL